MERPNQEISHNNQLTCEIEIKTEKDDEVDENYGIDQSNILKSSSDGSLENDERTLTSELSIKYENQETTDAEFIDSEPEASKIRIEKRVIFKANPDVTKKIAVRKLFLYKASLQCGVCSHVTSNWEDWQNHVLHHKKVITIPKILSVRSEVPRHTRKSRQRTHCCVFCHRDISNFARHLFRNHPNEIEVQKIKTFPPLSQKRKEMLSILRKRGNFLYRSENPRAVRTSHNGELLPCMSCMGFYSAANLSRHRKKCCEEFLGDRIPHKVLAQNFLLKDAKVDSELKEKVFMIMRPDKLSLIAKSDPIICEYAAGYLKSSENCRKTSLKMRELARLLMCAQNLEPSIKKMSDLLRTNHYWTIVQATKILSRNEVDMDNVPLIVRNIIASVKKCCDIAVMKNNGNTVTSLSPSELQKDIRKLRAYIQFNLKADIIGQTANDGTKRLQILVNQQVGPTVSQPWTPEQKNLVISHFDTNLKTKVQPKREDCIKLKKLYPDLLGSKSWYNIHRLVKTCIFRKNDNCKRRVLIQWTKEQKKVANSFFKEYIDNNIPPRKFECIKLIQMHRDLFQNKDWRKIKVYVQNQYVKNNKAKTSSADNRAEPSGIKVSQCIFQPREDQIPSNVSDDEVIIGEDMEADITPSEVEKEPESCDDVADQASEFVPALLEEPMEARISCDDVIIKDLQVNIEKTDSSKNRRNQKLRFCCLCETKVRNYARHLISTHRKQVKVRNIIYSSIYDPKKNILLTKFRRKGKQVTKQQKSRAGNGTTRNNNKQFILCRNCQGYFRYSLFREHKMECKEPLKYRKRAQQNDSNKKSHSTPSFDNMRKSFDFYDSLGIKNIIETIRLDETAVVGMGDILICRYADQVFKKTTGPTVRHVVSNTIRELGRMLIHLRTMTNYDNLIDNLRPELYDSLFEATKIISGYNSESKTFQYSYLSVKTGKVLKDICGLAIKMIRKNSATFELKDKDQTERNLGRLLTLIQHHWSSDLLQLEKATSDESVVSFNNSSSGEETDDDKLGEPAYNESIKVPRIKYTEEEKNAIRSFFKKHIQKKQSPKKLEVLEFMSEHKQLFKSKNWVKIKAFVYNEYRLK